MNNCYSQAIFIILKPVKNRRHLEYLFHNLEIRIGQYRQLFTSNSCQITNREYIITFAPWNVISDSLSLFEEENLLIKWYDVTQEIMNGRNYTHHMIIKLKRDPIYLDVFEKFIDQNQSVDRLLDKIIDNGIETLSPKEIAFLDNANV